MNPRVIVFFVFALALPAPARMDPAAAAFGYTDSTGTKLLTLSDDNLAIDVTRAKSMETAVCSEGREFAIRYLQFQKSTAANNGRQSANNLKNDEGHLFEIAGGSAEPGDTCLLVPANFLRDYPIARNDFSKAKRLTEFERKRNDADSQKQLFDMTPFQPTGQFAKETLDRIQKEKGRTAKVYWPLHSAGSSPLVAVVEFTPEGDSLLASVVLAEPSGLSFLDLPASLKEGRARGGCWRVDDDCNVNFQEMDVPAVLGVPGELLVFYTAWGAEGQTIVLFQAKGGKLVEVRRAYRYHSPI